MDLVATDFAIQHGIAYGGWVPKGNTNENGKILPKYNEFVEAEQEGNNVRTKLNVGSADATLIISNNSDSSGTRLTKQYVKEIGKPFLEINLELTSMPVAVKILSEWLANISPIVLNVAGPRESEAPKLPAKCQTLLELSLLPLLCTTELSDVNLRHWDNIRWIVPFWYMSASGVAYASFESDEVFNGEVMKVAVAMAIVGLACIYLVYRTIVLHREEVKRIKLSNGNKIGSTMMDIKFNVFTLKPTATQVFMLIQLFVVISWCCVALWHYL